MILNIKKPLNLNKYLKIQRENILKRIAKFGDKLYFEFGGKLFDDSMPQEYSRALLQI